ncbi:glycosyltransferase family 2 protein [archaeon]|nr:glycosyltransferase family 2 protein [archaeon]MBL7036431.1 glycosyltransferase family 2 protein [Candidatus Microgenomates bacterium]
MKLSIVIPARNEEANIENMASLLLKNFSRQIERLIIVNDCSTDSSNEILETLKKTNKKIFPIHRRTNPGVGNALKAGYEAVSKKPGYVLSLDCDFTKNIKDIKKMIKLASKTDADVVLGSRYMKGGKLLGYPTFKKIANRCFHVLARVLLGFRQVDVTNNFKLMKKEVLKDILPMLSGKGFSVNAETGIYPILLGYDVIESPVSWISRSEDMGKSSFKVINAGPGYIDI